MAFEFGNGIKEEREKVMGFVSHIIERSDLKAGDHIYAYRAAFTYSHHGIYVGEDRVVHFTQERYFSSCVDSSSTCLSMSSTFCGFKKGQSGVTISCLNCFTRKGSLRRYEYGVGSCTFISKRGGTCTTAKSDDPESVVHKAMYLLYNGFGEYKLFRNNCEDFALYCKTGLLVSPKHKAGGSAQVWKALVGVRYYMDIGVRSDVEKVEVEDLTSFLANKCGD